MTDSFPRQQARTRRFSLGVPRSFRVSPDGRRIAFLRSRSGTDAVTCLWVLDLPADGGMPPAGAERLVVDPGARATGTHEPEAERARRERSREQADGIVAFATDRAVSMAAFALGGEVYTAGLGQDADGAHLTSAASPAIDPRPDPSGRRVAYVCDGALRVTELATGADRALASPDGPEVTLGLAEFVAAEEMGRSRGYWWSPDGEALLVARVDNSPVARWHIADPANPAREPAEVRYPAAGTANAEVRLLVLGLDGASVPVSWDAGAYPYLVTASWESGDPLITVQSRDQRRIRLLEIDPTSGATRTLREDYDSCWLDIVPGVPARTAGSLIVWAADAEDARRLFVASEGEHADGSAAPVTPAGMQVRGVLSVDGDTVLFSASQDEPTEIGVWTYGPHGLRRVSGDLGVAGAGRHAPTPAQAGVHSAVRAGGTTVLVTRSMAGPGVTTTVLRDAAAGDGGHDSGPRAAASIGSLAERPALPAITARLLWPSRKEIRTALLLPSWHEPGSGRLPVLMDPYGGPHAQRVLASADAYLASQWFAEQGFAVVVADGRGTPGRGPGWERAVAGDLAGPVLEDQVEALLAVAEHHSDLDLSRVGIRGWSFGGYLSALAVLRRPDVFHAAVAGAPVTDWRLYDTHYTERYLGHPDHEPTSYQHSSLIDDAHRLSRPLMIIHGLADDNVVVAHTLRLSSALLGAGRPHSVLPLSGVTHMASQEAVAENLLLLQVDFLRAALGVG